MSRLLTLTETVSGQSTHSFFYSLPFTFTFFFWFNFSLMVMFYRIVEFGNADDMDEAIKMYDDQDYEGARLTLREVISSLHTFALHSVQYLELNLRQIGF